MLSNYIHFKGETPEAQSISSSPSISFRFLEPGTEPTSNKGSLPALPNRGCEGLGAPGAKAEGDGASAEGGALALGPEPASGTRGTSRQEPGRAAAALWRGGAAARRVLTSPGAGPRPAAAAAAELASSLRRRPDRERSAHGHGLGPPG